jgi:hypothetical protein
MTRTFKLLFTALFLSSLIACDIKPISVGNWEIRSTLGSNSLQSNWTISDDYRLIGSGDWNLAVDQVELDGSRIAFSAQIPLAANQLIDGNFSGTVSGNSLQGTFFTTEGNFTILGERQ